MTIRRYAGALALAALIAGPAAAQETTTLTVASYVSSRHGMSQWIESWAAELEEKSEGRLEFEILHGAQMGPPPNYYDLARNGQADITWVLHGATPGRFELTELSNMPFLFCSAEQATKVLNNPDLRETYLDPEHRGVRVLMIFAHPPGQITLAEGEATSVADLEGRALRPVSRAVSQYISALGAKPVGLPPTEMAEALQKGTLGGALIDYGGAALAFQLGPHLNSVSEVYAYTSSFALVMNPDAYGALAPDLQTLIDESVAGREAEVGQVWDGLDVLGKEKLQEQGVRINVISGDELARFREIGAEVATSYVDALSEKGEPAEDALAMMRGLTEEVGRIGPGCR